MTAADDRMEPEESGRWGRAGSASTRTVDAIIAGAQKAGTTSLHRYLGQHPQVVTHDHREMTYFVVDREYREPYRRVFDRYFSGEVGQARLLLAKSAGVMFYPDALDRLQSHNPNCRIVVSLRNPVERAYSAYWYMRRKGRETAASFEEALSARLRSQASSGWRSGQRAYLRRGHYADQLERVTDCFGREAWTAVLLEDLQRDARSVCRSLYGFLNLDPSFEPEVDRHHNPAKTPRSELVSRALVTDHPLKRALGRLVPFGWRRKLRNLVEEVNETTFRPPPMSAATRRELIEHFRPHNERLERLLDRDLSAWNRLAPGSDKAKDEDGS